MKSSLPTVKRLTKQEEQSLEAFVSMNFEDLLSDELVEEILAQDTLIGFERPDCSLKKQNFSCTLYRPSGKAFYKAINAGADEGSFVCDIHRLWMLYVADDVLGKNHELHFELLDELTERNGN